MENKIILCPYCKSTVKKHKHKSWVLLASMYSELKDSLVPEYKCDSCGEIFSKPHKDGQPLKKHNTKQLLTKILKILIIIFFALTFGNFIYVVTTNF